MSKKCSVCMSDLPDDALCCPVCGGAVKKDAVSLPDIPPAAAARPAYRPSPRGFWRIFVSAFFSVLLLGGIFAATLLGSARYSFFDGQLSAYLSQSGFYRMVDIMQAEGRLDSGALAKYIYENLEPEALERYGMTEERLREMLEREGVDTKINDEVQLSHLLERMLTMRNNPGPTFIFITFMIFNALLGICLLLMNHRHLTSGLLFCGVPLAFNGVNFIFFGLLFHGVRPMGISGALAEITLYMITRFNRISLIFGLIYLVVGAAFIILAVHRSRRPSTYI